MIIQHKMLVILLNFNKIWIFLTDVGKILKYKNSCPVTEGLTDRRAEGRKKIQTLRSSLSFFAILQTRLIEWCKK